MTYALTQQSLHGLRRALTTPMDRKATLHLERPASRVAVMLELEQVADKLAVIIVLGHHRSTIRLQANDPANTAHLCEQIEAIANGTADTAETGAIGAPSSPPQLCLDDRNAITLTAQKGGHAVLFMGATITVHQHDLSRRTVIGTHNGETWISSGSVNDIISSLRESLQQRLVA